MAECDILLRETSKESREENEKEKFSALSFDFYNCLSTYLGQIGPLKEYDGHPSHAFRPMASSFRKQNFVSQTPNEMLVSLSLNALLDKQALVFETSLLF